MLNVYFRVGFYRAKHTVKTKGGIYTNTPVVVKQVLLYCVYVTLAGHGWNVEYSLYIQVNELYAIPCLLGLATCKWIPFGLFKLPHSVCAYSYHKLSLLH